MCGGYACMMVYFDSLEPGVCPPTPVSPTNVKRDSGHTIHISYGMCILNGFAMFAVVLWYLQDQYLLLYNQ
ncbi:ADP-ribosylation factor-like protein 6-interacting protein 6 [Tubulanus polymorphus]|uniref:ADP-ribosylation factor-like protein 6-interacting protein 6 n=1 Tax=Tubulanus polymorphus TaxID=672921 RepID=UPI003DA56373